MFKGSIKSNMSVWANRAIKSVAAIALGLVAAPIFVNVTKTEDCISVANPYGMPVKTETVSKLEQYSVETVYVEDDTIYEGDSEVFVEGSDGVREEVLEITYDNGKTVSVNVIDTNIVKEAVAREVHVGTKVRPTYIVPVTNYRFTYGVGLREDGYHKGLDLVCAAGTPIKAAASGYINHADWMGGFGKLVVIDHGDGMVTKYAHMSEIVAVEGTYVEQGDIIGYVGCTGNSECNHLHFEMHRDGSVINPVAEGLLNP